MPSLPTRFILSAFWHQWSPLHMVAGRDRNWGGQARNVLSFQPSIAKLANAVQTVNRRTNTDHHSLSMVVGHAFANGKIGSRNVSRCARGLSYRRVDRPKKKKQEKQVAYEPKIARPEKRPRHVGCWNGSASPTGCGVIFALFCYCARL